MSVPNIQQQLYLKKALNESTDGMFDHPTLDEDFTTPQRNTELTNNIIAAVASGRFRAAKKHLDRLNDEGADTRNVYGKGGRKLKKAKGFRRVTEATLDEGSMSVSKLGKGKTFNPLKWDKLMAKNAWRQRTREGSDPRKIADPAIGKGFDNRLFQTDAAQKREKAFKEKGIVRKPRKVKYR